ncbi:hypothetical protein GOBAR_AA25094 [Gossypium barbadense]|uniref:Uncharacterized protein n=1 Tax=Gossypium barbadense TaxID=3634 RepID=A0A2P5WX13_GOSBA|nr:hypothetical protein GOBAR_AA25094 [Gossypium barbadense]
MEQLNAIAIQDEEGLVTEPRPETEVSIGKDEVGHNKPKQVITEYKPCVPYPNATRKDHSDEQFSELTLHVGDETITLQAHNSNNTSKIKGDCTNNLAKTSHIVQPSLQKIGSKNIHRPSSNKEPIHEERRLQIEELDEWQTHKLRKHDKPKPRHEELNSSKNQLKVGDKVLLDAADPRSASSEPNEETPLTVINIFPYGTVEVNYSKFGTFKINGTCLKPYVDKIDSRDEECKLLDSP